MISLRQDWPKILPQLPSLEVFSIGPDFAANMNEQPANGRRDDPGNALMVLEVSRTMSLTSSWAQILLIICQLLVVLFVTVEPTETTAGML